MERAADYITYISYGELFFSGSKDEFVDMFRIVKGGTEELSADLKEKAVGVRTFSTGFEALVKTEDTVAFSSLSIEPAARHCAAPHAGVRYHSFATGSSAVPSPVMPVTENLPESL